MQVGRVTFHCDTDTVDLGGFPAAKNYSLLQLQAFWDLVFPKPLTEDTNKWNWNFIGGKRDVSVNIDSSHRKLETITKTKGSNLESPLDLSKQLKTNVLFSNRFMSIPRLQQWNVHLTFWLGAKKAEEFITGRAFPQTEVYLISYQMSALLASGCRKHCQHSTCAPIQKSTWWEAMLQFLKWMVPWSYTLAKKRPSSWHHNDDLMTGNRTSGSKAFNFETSVKEDIE